MSTKWLIGLEPLPSIGEDARARLTKDIAVSVAVHRSVPFASSDARAAASVQPVPCPAVVFKSGLDHVFSVCSVSKKSVAKPSSK